MLKFVMIIFVIFNILILYIINNEVKAPYMDEIFHFPQALKYYHGIFTDWDPKITTPPGLYISTLFLLLPLSGLTGVDHNKVQSFRLINVFFTIGNFYLLKKILRKCHEGYENRVYIFTALNLSIFPVLYFFTFLYYTDCGSTFFVLLMYYLHLKHHFKRASIAGAISLLFRQTNIVWVFYVAAGTTLDLLHVIYNKMQQSKKSDKNIEYFSFTKINLPPRKEDWKSLLFTIIRINIGYILVALCFVKFVIENGSIALGDKEAHQVCFNVPQVLYFSLMFSAFSCPYLLSPHKVKDFFIFIHQNKVRVFEACLLCAFIIMHLTYVHPYLLADNRHFTFYIWRRILGRDMNFSFALIPFYIYSFWSIYTELEHKNDVFKMLLAFCIFVSTVPQKLLEFRYFIIPYIMLRVQFKVKSAWLPYLEFVLYTVINYVVMYLFLFNTFIWENNDEIQRFMW